MLLAEASTEDWDAEIRRRWSRANSKWTEIEQLQYEIRIRSSDSGWYHRIGYWIALYREAHDKPRMKDINLHDFTMFCQEYANKRRFEMYRLQEERKKLNEL